MNTFKIALLQINPGTSMDNNLSKGIKACRQAKSLDADLALFPEMWHIGYSSNLMQKKYVINHHSNFITTFKNLAKELTMAIATTYLAMGTHKPTNNVAIIDRNGKIILDYAKVHICNFTDGTEQNLKDARSLET